MESKLNDDEPSGADAAAIKIKLNKLEIENKKMQEEFNLQRAKLKELFLQKEGECKKLSKEKEKLVEEINEIKSKILIDEYKREYEIQHQDRKAQEEIASLQHLVHETIEESSHSKSEIDRILTDFERLRTENNELRELIHSQQQDSPSLAPVISHVKKTIARKLGADTSSSDYLEDSMRKAQEDAEVLRSLVVPLEEEIKALKEKLRTTDDELQHFHKNKKIISSESGSQQINLAQSDVIDDSLATTNANSLSFICEKCPTSELKLNESLSIVAEQKKQIESLKKDVERFKDELVNEAALRSDLENQWQEKREAHKKEMESLTEKVTATEKDFILTRGAFKDFRDDINAELITLTAERENIHRHLETLQRDNDFLAGKYLETSEELQNQRIDMPSNVDELQVLLLKCHENLIEARVGCEFEQRKSMSYHDEAQLLRDQLQVNLNERHTFERDTADRIFELEYEIKQKDAEYQKLRILKESFDKKEMDFQKHASEYRVHVIELREQCEKFEKLNIDIRNKNLVLQQELANSEEVQKDFVRLSQSLQMELEKIRAADTTIRWQDDDDVDNCPSCKTAFAVTRRKQHCRHCGTIYCEKCLTKSVVSGQSKKLATVCDVCHTLLVRNTAPYFSHAPPQSPT